MDEYGNERCELYVVQQLRAKHDGGGATTHKSSRSAYRNRRYNDGNGTMPLNSAVGGIITTSNARQWASERKKSKARTSNSTSPSSSSTNNKMTTTKRNLTAGCRCKLNLKRRVRALVHSAASSVPRELQLQYLSGGRDTPHLTTYAALLALCIVTAVLCVAPCDAIRHAGPVVGPIAAASGTLVLLPACFTLLARAVIHTPLMNPWFSFCSSAVNEAYALLANAQSVAATTTLCAALVKLGTRYAGAFVGTLAGEKFQNSSAQRALFALYGHTTQYGNASTHWFQPSASPLIVALVACVVLPRRVAYKTMPRYTLVACIVAIVCWAAACFIANYYNVNKSDNGYPTHYDPLPHNLIERFEGAAMRSVAMPLLIVSAWQTLAHTFAHTKFAHTRRNVVDVMSISIVSLWPIATVIMASASLLSAYTIQNNGAIAIQIHGAVATSLGVHFPAEAEWTLLVVSLAISIVAAPLCVSLLCAAQFRSHTRLAMENLTVPRSSTGAWNGQSKVPHVAPLLRFALEFVVPLSVLCNEQVLLEASACAAALLVCTIGAAHHVTQSRQVIFSAVFDSRPTFWRRNRTLAMDALVVLCSAIASLLCAPSIVNASMVRTNIALYIALRVLCGLFALVALWATFQSWKTRRRQQHHHHHHQSANGTETLFNGEPRRVAFSDTTVSISARVASQCHNNPQQFGAAVHRLRNEILHLLRPSKSRHGQSWHCTTALEHTAHCTASIHYPRASGGTGAGNLN